VGERTPGALSAAAVLDSMSDGFVAIDHEWRVIYVNTRGAEIQGRAPELLLGRNLFEIYPDAVGTSFESAYRKAMTERVLVQIEAYYAPWDRWFNQRIYPTEDGIAIFFVDITERKRGEKSDAGQRRVMELIAADAPLQETLDEIVRLIEAQSPELMGSILLADDDGLHLRRGAAPSLPADYVRAIDGQATGPRAGSCGTAAYRGAQVIVEDIETDALWSDHRAIANAHGLRACWSTPILDPQHRLVGTFAIYLRHPGHPSERHNQLIEMAVHTAAIAIAKDRAERERVRAQAALRSRELMFRMVFENAAIGMTLSNTDQKLVRSNRAFATMLGYTDTELRGRKVADVLHPDDRAERLRLYRSLAVDEIGHFQADLRYRRKDGSLMWGRLTASHVPKEGDAPQYSIGMIEDITERKRAEAHIEYLATHDALTGLPNHNLTHDRLTQAMVHVRRTGRLLAVLYLDMDRFKVINDGFGHPFGDAVIRAVGERLKTAVRDGDTVARQSGDEFLVLLNDVRKVADVYVVAQKALDAFAMPLSVQGREVHVAASIGISVYPQDGQSADALIENADAAMYRAKKLGGNSYQFFTREMSDETKRRVDLETQLRLAIARDQLHLAYQPKVEIASGLIIGCEALLRWTHPEIGGISPAQFIPIAEESGQIVPIGDWVLRTAAAQNKMWLDAGLPPIVVSVNISARQFQQQDVAAWVLGTLRETGLAPDRLELELTESLIAQDVEQAIHATNQLKSAGVKLSIDDFGTGYSNLGNLKRFRVDTLKIDQSFVRNVLTDADDASIALAVISLAHSLRMRVLAEGVETAGQYEFLRLHDCDEIQGYYFSKPVPAGEMAAMLQAGKRLAAADSVILTEVPPKRGASQAAS
jgi:diguanylate cyclase (GGDEF)-like protein/PAS domain S-box-containing protein